jgi:hypothetical protein
LPRHEPKRVAKNKATAAKKKAERQAKKAARQKADDIDEAVAAAPVVAERDDHPAEHQ